MWDYIQIFIFVRCESVLFCPHQAPIVHAGHRQNEQVQLRIKWIIFIIIMFSSNPSAQGGSLFGGTGVTTGGLFSQQSTGAPALATTSGPSIFAKGTGAPGGLFGQPTTGATGTGSMFGGQPSTQQPTGSLFTGVATDTAPATTTSTGLFAGVPSNPATSTTQPAPFSATPSTGIFGANTQQPNTNTAAGGLFGNKPSTPEQKQSAKQQLISQVGVPISTTTSQPSGGLFGNQSSGVTPLAAGGPFSQAGQAQTVPSGQTSGGLFGQAQTTSQPAAQPTPVLTKKDSFGNEVTSTTNLPPISQAKPAATLFSNGTTAAKDASPAQTPSLFANTSGTTPAMNNPTSAPLFGATIEKKPDTTPGSLFGGNSTSDKPTSTTPTGVTGAPTQTFGFGMDSTKPSSSTQAQGQTQPQGQDPNANIQDVQQKLIIEFEKSNKSAGEYVEEWKKALVECYREINNQCTLVKGYTNDRRENYDIIRNFNQLEPVVRQSKKSTELLLDSIEKKQVLMMSTLMKIKEEFGVESNPRYQRDHVTTQHLRDCREIRKEISNEDKKYEGESEQDSSNQQFRNIFLNLDSVENEIRRLNHVIDHYFGKPY